MADRYWVGGTASWDATAGTKWATTSGGPGGASVPTAADDVYFDAASGAVTVTVAAAVNCRSLIFTGFTGTFAGTNTVSMYGTAVTLSSGMTWTHSTTLGLRGSCTFTSNGKSITSPIQILDGVTVQLADALSTTGAITLTQGTFTTNDFNVTATQLSSNNSNARTINLGSSTVTLTLGGQAILFTTSTNLTFNAGTSNIILTGSGADIEGGGLTFYDVSFTGTTPSSGTTNVRYIDGVNTFNNLSISGPSTTGAVDIELRNSQIINGVLSTTSTTSTQRVWFRSNTYGIRRNITLNGSASLTDADFRDIRILGNASPISGTRIGNRGLNSGITFDAPKTVYWNLSGSQNWTSTGWADSSGGTPNAINYPLPQDTAIINNAGAAGTITINAGTGFLPNVDFSGRTNAVTVSITAGQSIYGNWAAGSGITYSGTSQALNFEGCDLAPIQTLTTLGKTGFTFSVNTIGGKVMLNDAYINTASNSWALNYGIFDSQGYNMSWYHFEPWNVAGVRACYFRNSTLTSNGNYPVGSATSAGATGMVAYDWGTSTLICTGGVVAFYGFGLSYNNITINSGNPNLSDSFICNNLTIAAPGSNGLSSVTLSGNVTVNGTMSCSGATSLRRVFIRSSTIGTQRTITANAWSSPADIDFRDIRVTGTVGTISGTRLGDCGGNSGVTTDTPKTVYRVGTNTTWNGSSSWAITSNGTGSDNNFPLPQDTAVIDESTALTGSLSIGAFNISAIDCSTRTTGITVNFNNSITFYGSIIIGSGVNVTGNAGITYSGTGVSTFITAGRTITTAVTVNTLTGTLQLGDSYTASASLTLTSGTLDAVTYNVTCTGFTGQQATTLKMGSGLWTLTGTGTVWNLSSSGITNFFKGTADILLSNNTTTARTFTGGGMAYNKLTIGGDTSTSTTTISQNNTFFELASTKTVAHTIALGTTTQTFGKWTVTGSAGNVVTLTGTGTTHVIAGSATSGIDYLVMGSIGFSASSPGEFYAGPNSTGTAAAPVYRTAPPSPRTLYWVGGTGNWSDTSKWSLSSGGSGGEAIPTSLDNVIFDSASNATAYTLTVNTDARFNELTMGAPASGSLTWAHSGAISMIAHGNFNLSGVPNITRTYNRPIVLSGSTTGKIFTTNNLNLGPFSTVSVTVNGAGCEWTLGSAITAQNDNSINVTMGSFSSGNYTMTVSQLVSNVKNTTSINLGSSTVSLSNGNGVVFSNPNLTFNAGTSSITFTASSVTINGDGQTFYDVTLNAGINTRTINGTNTFYNLTLLATTNGLQQLALGADQTVTNIFTCAGNSSFARGFVRSNVIGTTRTITAATMSANDCDFRDINITGGAADTAPTRAGDCGGNSGIIFPAPKTVYRSNKSTSQSYDANNWSLTSGGAADINNLPLPQDTAIFDNTSYSVFQGSSYNLPNIDASSRTTSMTFVYNGVWNCYGSLKLPQAGTMDGSGNGLNFLGRGNNVFNQGGITQITQSAVTIDCFSGSITLETNMSIATNITLTSGTFNTNNYNVTCSTFSSNNSNTRSIAMGSGTWTITGTGTVWTLATTTNLTFDSGTAQIVLSSTSTSARTFNGGGLSYNKLTIGGTTGVSTLTINNNNGFFTEIASTKTVAHTIALPSFLKVGAWTVTGSSGNVVTLTGASSGLYKTTSGAVNVDFLNLAGIALGSNFEGTGVWYAGTNSLNSGSGGWEFIADPNAVVETNSGFFMILLDGGQAEPPPVPTADFVTSVSNNSTSSSYSFTNTSIGDADASRTIAITVSWNGGISGRLLSTATIGGVSATIVQTSDAAGFERSAIAYATVPSGTTATISLSFNGSIQYGVAVGVFRMLGVTSVLSGVFDAHNNTTTTYTTNINVETNDYIISAFGTGLGVANWTNTTEHYTYSFFSDYLEGASSLAPSTGSRSISVTGSAYGVLTTVAFRFT